MAYDKRYRTRVVEYVLAGHTQEEAASIFNVGTTSIKRWLAKFKTTGSPGGGYVGGIRRARKVDSERLDAYMKEYPDALLKEIAEEFSCGVESARRALLRNGYTRKKRPMRTESAMKRREAPLLKR